MKEISLNRIFIQNYRSYREECVTFTQSVGIKHLGGENKTEPRLGANGSGKSSLWSAICWCWFGVGVKGERTSSILTWDQKTTEVLTEVTVNGKLHTIYRSGPPERIQLDEIQATQDDIDNLLGLNRKRFLHSIIFGQGVSLFPDITTPERGALLDDVLSLGVWQKASDVATKKVSELEKEASKKNNNLAYLNGKLSQMESEESIQKAIDNWELDRQSKLEEVKLQKTIWEDSTKKEIKVLEGLSESWKDEKEKELENISEELNTLELQFRAVDVLLAEPVLSQSSLSNLQNDIKTQEAKLQESKENLYKLNAEREQITSPRSFWETNATCPVCFQVITEVGKKRHLDEIKKKERRLTYEINEVEQVVNFIQPLIIQKKDALSFAKQSITEQVEQRKGHQKEYNRLESEIKKVEDKAKQLLKSVHEDNNPFINQIKQASERINPFITQIESTIKLVCPFVEILNDNRSIRHELQYNIGVQETDISNYESSIMAAEYWKNGFKRIRLYFVNQVLTALQIDIQSAISNLGLDGWSVKLATEMETKSGTTKLGVQIRIKSPIQQLKEVEDKLDKNAEKTQDQEWSVWSGGESQRLRLAMAMGLSSLIQRAAGVWYNFEIWDEPTSWLGAEGIEDLLQALQYRADVTKKSIWITDHRALTFSGFQEIWSVVKEVNGSKVYMINQMEA